RLGCHGSPHPGIPVSVRCAGSGRRPVQRWPTPRTAPGGRSARHRRATSTQPTSTAVSTATSTEPTRTATYGSPPGGNAMGRTLAEKVWDDHVVRRAEGEPDLLYIDLHLVHEVTSPQAFDGLRKSGRRVRRPDLTIAT